MSLDDIEVAAYRDAVLWSGVLLRITPKEAATICRKILTSSSTSEVVTKVVGRGLFFMDDDDGAILAIPKIKPCVDLVKGALRVAGLGRLAARLGRAAGQLR